MAMPNIVLICADDLGFNEIEAYRNRGIPDKPTFGDSAVHTPHIDSLARDGAIFGRYYVTSAICSPSRYSILTGRVPSRSPSMMRQHPPGTPATIGWNTTTESHEDNLAKRCKAMGMATGFFGKWHTGNPKMDFSAVDPDTDPTDPSVAQVVKQMYDRGVDHLRDGQGFDVVDRVYFGNKEYLPPKLQVHNLEWIAEGAVEFIDQHKDDPFFLYMATTAPHGDQKTAFLQDDPCYTSAGVLSKRPESMPRREEIPDRLEAAGISSETAMCTWIDDAVGAVLDRLEAHGLADNTIVMFTGDHLGRGKYMCYEGCRVPMIVRWPGHIQAGLETDALCANVDLVATLTELAGGRLPDDYDTNGMSFADLLLRPYASGYQRDHIYLECSNIRGVVTDRWKYIANRVSDEIMAKIEADAREAEQTGLKRLVGWDGRVNPHAYAAEEGIRYFAEGVFEHYFDPDQLYDLHADPWERTNLFDDPQYADVVARLQDTLRAELIRLPHTFGEFTS